MSDLLRIEQETVINFNDEEKTASVYTRQRVIMRKLDALCEKYPEAYKLIKRTEIDATYEMPKKLISFRSPKVLTEEQKAASREALMKARDAKINSTSFS